MTHPASADSILEKDFHSLKAELEVLAAGLDRSEQSDPAQLQSRLGKQRMHPGSHVSSGTLSAAHQDGAYYSSRKHGLTSKKSATHIGPLQQPSNGSKAFMSTLNADQYGPDKPRQQGTATYAESDLHNSDAKLQNSWIHDFERETEDAQTAADAHDWKYDDHEQDGFAEHGQGPRRGSRGAFRSPQSVLGCSSLRSLPVLNNSFIVPAQAAKPKKVDRVTRYRSVSMQGYVMCMLTIL